MEQWEFVGSNIFTITLFQLATIEERKIHHPHSSAGLRIHPKAHNN
jgi:hypothetical protein